ncbi:DNA primase [Candidatus Eisenbacteria bacterium]|uniref:DNA primase n=1 Tax=Eiseniibacteriota bacterium TaxID=2212470 RepID=A0ABV6YNA0_UNCEI
MTDSDFRAFVEEVRAGTDIVQVITERIPLNASNKALCPFHAEKQPSFSVNPKGQFFYCFGCGVGGDVFRFLELHDNRGFMDVLLDCARKAGVDPPMLTDGDTKQISGGRLIGDILCETAKFYHERLTKEVRDYLTTERGINEEMTSRFQIGWASGGLVDRLTEKCGFPLDLCLRAGVLRTTDGGKARDYFHKRIIFPNLKYGRVVHLTGRVLKGRGPKYLHLPGEIRHLYNEGSLSNREVCLTEGAIDCISAEQAGFPAVALLGVSGFKPEYVAKFSRCEKVYLCLDGDKPGRDAAFKIAESLGPTARILELPDGQDLNDYFKAHEPDDFRCLLDAAQDSITYRIELINPETDKTELPHILDPVLRSLSTMPEPRTEAHLTYGIKKRFGLKKEDVDTYRKVIKSYRQGGEASDAATGAERTQEVSYTALFDGLVDLAEHEGAVAFLVKEGDDIAIHTEIERDGRLYVPPLKDQVPWLLPRASEVLRIYEERSSCSTEEMDAALYDDLLAYHKRISELPNEEYYDLIAAWDFHTYLLEQVQYSPIICLFAVPERGKSRTGKGMTYVAYRGLHVESLREAYLIRVANDLGVSVFFDVMDIWRKAERYGSEDILLQRFEKGATVPRVMYPDKGAHRDIVYYSIFGPTVIGTNRPMDRILDTRAVSINMPASARKFESDVTSATALPLKERLVAFRARRLGQRLPSLAKPALGRLGDILKPIHQVILLVRPERESAFLDLVAKLGANRLADKSTGLEAQILSVMRSIEEKVEKGLLPIKAITDTLNDGRPDNMQLTYHKVGWRLAAMGFEKGRLGDGARAVVWDMDLLGRMEEAYGLRKTSETSELSEIEVEITDVSDDSDVIYGPL